MGLNRKRHAYFFFPRDDSEVRLMAGDELKLRHRSAGSRGAWECIGYVVQFNNTEEVCLEMTNNVSGGGGEGGREDGGAMDRGWEAGGLVH